MLTIVMSLFLALSISASATETSGNCGTNGENNRDGDSVKWEIRDDGKTLVFSGNGEMEGSRMYQYGRACLWRRMEYASRQIPCSVGAWLSYWNKGCLFRYLHSFLINR